MHKKMQVIEKKFKSLTEKTQVMGQKKFKLSTKNCNK